MPIRPSVAHSYKHLILCITATVPKFLNISLNSKNILLILYIYFVFNKFRNFVFEVTDALRKSLASSFKSSVT
jgi:hypothetical protein